MTLIGLLYRDTVAELMVENEQLRRAVARSLEEVSTLRRECAHERWRAEQLTQRLYRAG